MMANGTVLRAIAGAIALASLLAAQAGASALERPSMAQQAPPERPRLPHCDPASKWSRETFKAFATCQAAIYGLEPVLAHAVMEIESGFEPDVRGADGEVGLMQVMPATARMLGFRGSLDDLSVPATNIALGVEYLALANKLAGGDLCTTVMKYRAGHNERRFSALSVRYCERAQAILAREGLEVAGPLPVATFGFSALSGGEGTQAAGKGICVLRVFVPGPRYMKCADYRSAGQARRIKALRAQLFDG
ncbi:transglycosylase SLT domain-containing protein [Mesorhizobium sp.]|uniref:lytic transglycosylase domain-containing protein n=1 Tax=Mesorhizobium sp. TaxID=1871066 RepID=UPI00122933BF|nr:transglycosylase SLT domain-containing protein [Mesorhizobium sp.]TIS60106.1 MAG: lytic transglycosylase domain-containing protein [Mesorhizobium sp.]TIS89493.1 MAG: lytic transglycosylase domain-containing protein [Mesorhizobium sp.]